MEASWQFPVEICFTWETRQSVESSFSLWGSESMTLSDRNAPAESNGLKTSSDFITTLDRTSSGLHELQHGLSSQPIQSKKHPFLKSDYSHMSHSRDLKMRLRNQAMHLSGRRWSSSINNFTLKSSWMSEVILQTSEPQTWQEVWK